MHSASRISRQTWKFQRDIRLLGAGVATGPLEGQGPLAKEFDCVFDDAYAGEESWEKAERKLMEQAVHAAMKKSGVTAEQSSDNSRGRRDYPSGVARDLHRANWTGMGSRAS